MHSGRQQPSVSWPAQQKCALCVSQGGKLGRRPLCVPGQDGGRTGAEPVRASGRREVSRPPACTAFPAMETWVEMICSFPDFLSVCVFACIFSPGHSFLAKKTCLNKTKINILTERKEFVRMGFELETAYLDRGCI